MSEAFASLVAALPGEVVVAIAPARGGDPRVLGSDRPFHAWSTIKVPVLAAVLALVHVEALGAERHALARAAITQSDNLAILELFVLLEQLAGGTGAAAGVMERLLRLSGDERTRVALAPPPPGAITPFGQTEWSAADSARFFRALAAGELLDAKATGYVLGLMEQVTPDHRWGLGAVDLDGRAAFKGGWGPERDGTCLVRQVGVVLGSAGGGAAISLVAVAPPGEESFELGVEMVSSAAAWIVERPELLA